jgi:DNA-cytosine methyltransferase
MIKILDICSGIGGFSLGLEATGGFDTVAFCEFDDFCCKVLNKHWPNVPIYKDLKEIGNDPARIIQEFDLICGGIPCQPFSLAGKQKGKEDDRHLWPYMYAIVKSKKPTWVIVENVGGFVNVALDDVCLDLETQGYATQSFIIPACSVEAPHKRDRIWILGKLMANAHDTGDRTPGSKADGDRQETIEGWQEQSQLGSSRSSEDVGNTDNLGSLLSPHETKREGSTSRHSEGELERGSSDVANAQSNGEDGVLRTTEPKHDQGTHGWSLPAAVTDEASEESHRMWPTPRSSNIMNMTMESALNRIENTGYHSNLEEKVALEEQKMWPTPNSSPATASQTVEATQRLRASRDRKQGILIEAVVDKMWPTPNASDNRDRGNLSDPAIQRRIAMGKQVGLTMAVKDQPGKGTLNPNWVEWLMGYPQGWTDISDSSENPTSQG